MARWLSIHTPQQIREIEECGLHEAVFKHKVSKLLDTIEDANDIETLRKAVAEYITLQTKVL